MSVNNAGADRSRWKWISIYPELSASTVAFISKWRKESNTYLTRVWKFRIYISTFIVIYLLQRCLQTWVR